MATKTKPARIVNGGVPAPFGPGGRGGGGGVVQGGNNDWFLRAVEGATNNLKNLYASTGTPSPTTGGGIPATTPVGVTASTTPGVGTPSTTLGVPDPATTPGGGVAATTPGNDPSLYTPLEGYNPAITTYNPASTGTPATTLGLGAPNTNQKIPMTAKSVSANAGDPRSITGSSGGLGARGGYNPSITPYNPGASTPLIDASATDASAISTASKIDAQNILAQQAANAARIPNAPALEAQSSANIGNELQGVLPTDVLNQLGQASAERGVGGGQVGGPNVNAAYLRALGLTSLQEQQQGQSDLSGASARNPAAPLADASQFVETPYQQQQLALQQQQQQQQQQQFAAELALQQQRQQLQNALQAQALGGGVGGSRGPWTPAQAPPTGGYNPQPTGYTPTTSTWSTPAPTTTLGGIPAPPDKYSNWWNQYGGTSGGEIPGMNPGSSYIGASSGDPSLDPNTASLDSVLGASSYDTGGG